MQVIKSKYLTYCIGVKKAIDRVLNLLEENPDKKIYMLGEIVHNPHVVRMLMEKGVKTVKGIEEVPDKSVLVIRAHGTTFDITKQINERELEVVDATCSIVLNNQKLVRALEDKGYTIVLIGDRLHDEVISIISYAQNPIVISSKSEVYDNRDKLKKIAVILQTTEIIHNVKDIVAELVLYAHEMQFFNTICSPSRIKQDEVVNLAKENDVVYIVGSKTSKNTKNLYWLAKKHNDRTFFIEDKSMIELKQLEGANSIAIAAGTSTPEEIINEAISYLESL